MYYSKILFEGNLNNDIFTYLLLNLPARELSFTVIRFKNGTSAVIQKLSTIEIGGKHFSSETAHSANFISTGKTDFTPELLISTEQCEEVLFSCTEKLTEKQAESTLPFCKVHLFESYKSKSADFNKHITGYRDEATLTFKAISDSPSPYIELPMTHIYAQSHTPPTEKLYRYILDTFFKTNKHARNWLLF